MLDAIASTEVQQTKAIMPLLIILMNLLSSPKRYICTEIYIKKICQWLSSVDLAHGLVTIKIPLKRRKKILLSIGTSLIFSMVNGFFTTPPLISDLPLNISGARCYRVTRKVRLMGDDAAAGTFHLCATPTLPACKRIARWAPTINTEIGRETDG